MWITVPAQHNNVVDHFKLKGFAILAPISSCRWKLQMTGLAYKLQSITVKAWIENKFTNIMAKKKGILNE